MRFEPFKIGETDIKSVTKIEITKAPRNRIITTNLNGDMLIDQTTVKRDITVTVALSSAAQMQVFENAIIAGFSDITFYDGGELVTISATLSQISKPRPFYKNGNRESGVYYNNIVLEWRER